MPFPMARWTAAEPLSTPKKIPAQPARFIASRRSSSMESVRELHVHENRAPATASQNASTRRRSTVKLS